MHDVANYLKELAGPGERGDRIKSAIDRAARRSGLTYWRAFDIWYGKARRIEEYEKEAIVRALAKKEREDARRELHALKIRIACLESRLSQVDQDFYGETVDSLRAALRTAGE